MNKVKHDFVYVRSRKPGNIFEGDKLVAKLSKSMSRNKKKKWLREDINPPELCEYLSASGIIKESSSIPKGWITDWQLLDLLRRTIDENNLGNDRAEYLYKEIMKEKYPPRKRPYKKDHRKKMEN
jgi:hypothetical protein